MKTKLILLIVLLSTTFPLLAQKSRIIKEGDIAYIVRDSFTIENVNNKLYKNRKNVTTDKLYVIQGGPNGYNKNKYFETCRSVFSLKRCKELGKLRLYYYFYIDWNGKVVEIGFFKEKYNVQPESRPYECIKLSELKALEEAIKKYKTWDVQWLDPKYKNSNKYVELRSSVPFGNLYSE